MLQINRFEAITRGFTRMEVLIVWLWFQKWMKQDKGSSSKHNSRILATLATTTQKRSRWNLTTLLPKLQISDDRFVSSMMQENGEQNPPRERPDEHIDLSSYLSSHSDSYSGQEGGARLLVCPLRASNVFLRLKLGIQSSDIDSLSGGEAHPSSSSS